MPPPDLEETKRKIHHLTDQIRTSSWEGVENSLLDIVVQIHSYQDELRRTTPTNQDIAILVQEMRNGFAAMDRRFQAMERRFDDLIHQMDKRFEQVDKRFEHVDRRFEQVDKRFEQMDKRFNFMQWLFGTLLTFLSAILTYGTFFQ